MNISASDSPFAKPDFAFPKQVSATWKKELDKGLKEHNNPLIVRSLLNIGLAESSVASENRAEFLNTLSSLSKKQNKNQELCALLDLMQAEIYTQIYNDNRWNYDNRQLPLSPLPADYNEWSGDQFRLKINDLLKSALSNAKTLSQVKLSLYDGVITQSRYPVLYPTLLDFVAYNAIDMAQRTESGTIKDTELRDLAFDTLLEYQSVNSAPHFLAYLLSGRSSDSPMQLYEKNESEWYSGLALLQADHQDQRNLYFTMKDYINRFPASPLKDCIENEMNGMLTGSIMYKMPNTAVKGSKVKIDIEISNIKRARASLYTLKQDPRRLYNMTVDKFVKDTIIETNIEGPFKVKKNAEFTIPEYGFYTIFVTPDNEQPDFKSGFNWIKCTDLMIIFAPVPLLNDKRSDNILLSHDFISNTYIADLTTGLPVKDVTVTWGKDKNNTKKSQQAITNADGLAKIVCNEYDNYIYSQKGDDKFNFLSFSTNFPSNISIKKASVTTSLPIYNFGDSVEWCAVVYENKINKNNSPLANREVDASLISANRTIIKTVTCTTDEWGRVSGKFTLPENGLAGNFMVKIAGHESDTMYGSTSFVVSDYKLPTFTVDITTIDRNMPEKGALTVSGTARTYSNFPVAGAKVILNVNTVPFIFARYNFASDNLTNIETVTDANGNFTATVPAESIRGIESDKALMLITDVTSQGGETRSTSRVLSIGKPYYIDAYIAENVDVSSPVNFNIALLSPTNTKIERPVTLSFYKKVSSSNENKDSTDTIEESGNNKGIDVNKKPKKPDYEFLLQDPSLPIDLKKIESGLYDIAITPVDTTLAEPYTTNNKFFYNKNQNDFPLDMMVWTPYSTYSKIQLDDRNNELLVGTSREDLNLLCVVMTKDSILSSRWIPFHKGMNHIELSLPDGITEAYVTLAGANHNETFKKTYTVVTPANTRKLEFKIESFRDKVAPRSIETWRFRTNQIIGTDTIPDRCAVMLRLFSKAINDMSPINNLTFADVRNDNPISVWANSSSIFPNYFNARNTHVSGYINPFSTFPEFEKYGQNWMGYQRIMYKRMMAADAGMVAYGFASRSSNSKSESNDEDCLVEGAVHNGTGENPISEITYRPSEIPLALFEPMLVTNPDGTLEYSVTFPDASTTWLLNATAFNKDLYSAQINEEIVAAHPLMIQMALPRFMRLGDKTTVVATVMNNSGENLTAVATRFEAIDPSTGNVIAFAEEQVSLDNGQMKVVSLPLYIDKLTPGLLIRARAAGGNFADGEQSMIAILEASQPVVETKPFFLNPDQKTASVEVEAGKDATVTLEFYQNPTWSVVTALPGLRSGSYSTPIDAAAAICSAAIAEDLLKRNPAVGTAIRQWLDSDRADSTLVSMLQRNPDLKIALLEATPWMTDAMDDTQRMQRLSLLFDRKEIKSVYSTTIHRLAKLQRSKGWAWTENDKESSYWATLSTLEILGYLKQLGCLPADTQLDTMIKNAVEYVDAEAVKINRDIKGKVLPDRYYTLVRTPFKDIRQSTAARRVTEVTIQNIIANWKSYGLREKTFAAIILAENDYHSTAGTIVSSISEFAIDTPQKGMRWQDAGIGTTARILQAYALTSQPADKINAIRQWLILEKSANNWGNSADATCIIYNILATGSQWTPLNPGSTVVKVNNHEFTPDKVDNITGYFRADITDAVGSHAEVTVTRTGDTPAYGSVYSVSTRDMESIDAVGCDDLNIEKRFLVKQAGADGTTWKEATSFNVGDVVKVSLTVKVKATMQYVVINDNRAACLEPVNQLPTPVWSENICFYRQTGDSSSDIFINYLPEGTYILEQEFTVTNPGTFTSGIATAQSQYAPQYTAHSAGFKLSVEK
ncbi:MAG: hypothetical protein HDS58_02510 [Barnesiella sp.]|nr:hypothetical protein [Barnesiella sp.]